MALLTVESTRFGALAVPEEIVLDFGDGMIGFGGRRLFTLLKQREDAVFHWLHSLDDPALAFPLVLPWAFHPDYEARLADHDLAAVGATSAQELSVWCVASVPGDLRDATIDLLAPVIVNDAARRGRQVVNGAPGYGTRDPLFRHAHGPTPVAMRDGDAGCVLVLPQRAA